MQLKLLQEKEAKLLDRKELEIEATFEKSTPSEAEIKKQIASSQKADEGAISIKTIRQSFGIKKARIIAHIYKNKEQLKKIEKVKVKKKKEEKKAEEKK